MGNPVTRRIDAVDEQLSVLIWLLTQLMSPHRPASTVGAGMEILQDRLVESGEERIRWMSVRPNGWCEQEAVLARFTMLGNDGTWSLFDGKLFSPHLPKTLGRAFGFRANLQSGRIEPDDLEGKRFVESLVLGAFSRH